MDKGERFLYLSDSTGCPPVKIGEQIKGIASWRTAYTCTGIAGGATEGF